MVDARSRRGVILPAFAAAALCLVLPTACGGGDEPASDEVPSRVPTGGVCNVAVAEQGILPSPHVQECSFLPYAETNPPSSGPHYPIWAAYKSYEVAVPLGYLVHDLEHGGIVVFYNCPEGCADEVAKAQKVIDAFVDPLCSQSAAVPGVLTSKRVTMSPNPKLTTRFAMAAWGHTLNADCVDEASFAAFLKIYFDRGPETLCGDGNDVIATGLQPKCGEEDFGVGAPNGTEP
jgi:hypothetical protein